MKKKIINTKIWLPNDVDSIKVQTLAFRNMDKAINNVSKQLGATVNLTYYVPLGSKNRFTPLANSRLERPYRSGLIFPTSSKTALYEEYINEHPIIKILIHSFYNKRISYYNLLNYLINSPDFNIEDLMSYYNSFTFGDSNVVSISSIQKSMLGDIKETAHGYNPPESLLIEEYRSELAKRGEWFPTHGGILEEAEANDFVLKRVFKKNI